MKELRDSFNLRVLFLLSSLHLIFIVIIDKVTAFAPDEANYIGIFSNLYRTDFSLDGYLGWQEGSINALRLIYLPGKLLEIVGFSDFYCVRILSVLYSMLSLYLLLKLSPEVKILKFPIRFWITGAYLVPSVFLWSSLGLRESFIFFSFIAIFYVLVNPKNARFWKQFLLLAVASTFFLVSKIYLFGLLLACLFSTAVFLSILRKKVEIQILRLLSAFLVPLLIFPSITTNLAAGAKGAFEAKLVEPPPTPTPKPSESGSESESVPARGQTLHDLSRQFDKNPILYWFSSITGIREVLKERVEASYIEEGSQEHSENIAQLQTQPASLQNPLSLLRGAYNFLFVPTPFVDNGSFFLNVQSYESFIWYFYYLILISLLFNLIRGRYYLNFVTLSSTLFVLGFIVLSALIEINDGTSVRHRAVLLIGILIMLATFKRNKPKRLDRLQR